MEDLGVFSVRCVDFCINFSEQIVHGTGFEIRFDLLIPNLMIIALKHQLSDLARRKLLDRLFDLSHTHKPEVNAVSPATSIALPFP